MKRQRLWAVALMILFGGGASAAAQERPRGLPEGAKFLRNQEYVPGGHERQKLDLYLPAGDGPFPVLVWVHGGGWQAGSKDRCPAVPLVGRGYAVVSINYRLSQHARFPAQIEDCKAAVRWLRAQAGKYHLDKDRFGAWGASAGGHLVALLGTSGGAKDLEGKGAGPEESSRVQAVVDWFGPTDLTRMRGGHDRPNSPEAKLLGGPVQENKALAAKANPVAYVSHDSPPFLIMHGDKDRTVPFSQSQLLAEALIRAGVEVDFVPVPGAGHGGRQFGSPANRKLITEFFDRHLKRRKAGNSGAQGGRAASPATRDGKRPGGGQRG